MLDDTITIFVPKAAVGNPRPGDLLGAVNGRTFADNTTFERSTQLIDHTFVKAQTDNAYPAATYTIAGNNVCAAAPPPTPTPTPKLKHSPHGKSASSPLSTPADAGWFRQLTAEPVCY